MANGLKEHAVKSLPDKLSAAFILQTGLDLQAAEAAAGSAKSGKAATATTRSNLAGSTASIASRLGGLIRSRHGRTSKELAAYGLKVQVDPTNRKKSLRKAVPPPVATSSEGMD